MAKNQELMSQKEKDYVSFCFNRNIKTHKTDIDYEMVFNGQRIEYSLFEGRKEFKRIFGKQDKRSRKWFRPSSNTKTAFLKQRLMVCELFEIMSIMKFVNMDGESMREIESSALSYFEDCFAEIINIPKTFWFLEEFFCTCSEDARRTMVKMLFERCSDIREDRILFEFLDKNMSKVPASESLVSGSVWTCDSGYILGLFLILKDERLARPVFQSFVESPISDCKNLEKFVSVLYSLCNKSDKNRLRSKLLKSKIRNPEELVRDSIDQ